MSYMSVVEMAGSPSLISRIAAAAAEEGLSDPLTWVQQSIWSIVASDSGWAEAWDYARDTATLDHNPDTGARPTVINDSMILAVIQPMVADFGAPPA